MKLSKEHLEKMRIGRLNAKPNSQQKELTALPAIRKKCVNCSGFSYQEVVNCGFTDCPLYPYRFGIRPQTAEKQEKDVRCEYIKTPLKAIRANCLYCMNGSRSEVRLCPSHDCTLYPYRFGVRPETAARNDEKRKKKLMDN